MLKNAICFSDVDYSCPSEFFEKCWLCYESRHISCSKNDVVFKSIVQNILSKEKITPYYVDVKLNGVSSYILYDIILFSETKLINLIVCSNVNKKIDRIDLESIALKYIHFNTKSILLTLNHDDSIKINDRINKNSLVGIDECVCCMSKDIDDFIKKLKLLCYCYPNNNSIIEGKKVE